jgi:hypothetical protein
MVVTPGDCELDTTDYFKAHSVDLSWFIQGYPQLTMTFVRCTCRIAARDGRRPVQL